jgi:4'-phosphopantetheinyl transferase
VLSPDERSRAARFRFPRDRDRYVVARASLRHLLARYTGERPERLRFATGPLGKPRLDSQPGGVRVEFNLSHSGAVALYAVAGGRRVGIDVERILSVAEDDERLSGLWLSPAEVGEMSTMGAAARARAFYSLWARKEAYGKARGEGLSLGPDRVRVHGERVSEPGDTETWTLREVPVGDEYAAALVVEGECDAFAFRHWVGPCFAFGPT